MPKSSIKEFLKNHDVKYSTVKHTPAYTAPEIAANSHISGKILAKVVIVKLDGKFAMIVEPSHQLVNLNLLKEQTGAKKIELAS